MDVPVHEFGLKTTYTFRETLIPTSGRCSDIYRLLRDLVGPVVRILEAGGLIDSFHHYVAEALMLRLSCADWSHHEKDIRDVLSRHRIPGELITWELGPVDLYGGEEGRLLCYYGLESNSRLILAFIELLKKADDDVTRSTREYLLHHWVNFLFNQAGYLDAARTIFEFNNAFDGLHRLVKEHSGDPQVVSFLKTMAGKVKHQLAQFEQSMTNV